MVDVDVVDCGVEMEWRRCGDTRWFGCSGGGVEVVESWHRSGGKEVVEAGGLKVVEDEVVDCCFYVEMIEWRQN